MDLRNDLKVPHIGKPALEKLPPSKLPLRLHVFLHIWFFFKVVEEKETTAMRSAAKSVQASWNDAGLKPKKNDCIIVDIEDLNKKHKVGN